MIQHHLNKNKEAYPVTVPKLLGSVYVDDVLTGAETVEEAVKLVNEGDALFKEASMELSKWNSNYSQLFENSTIQESEIAADTIIKILGTNWNTESDKFSYNIEGVIDLAGRLKPSKRTVLKIVAKMFDPHGGLSPFLITGKILFQKLSKAKVTWDETLPDDIMNEWITWRDSLHLLREFSIPRCINTLSDGSMELIGFCDASMSAYAAVIYIRCCKETEVKTHLVMARSRVAPMKPMTIARMELLGAVLLVRLMSAVQEFLSDWSFDRTTYYTDSSIVFHWIIGAMVTNSYLKTRLDEIHQLSTKEQWYHCPGEENPADLATRGISMEQLITSKEWFLGPSWLIRTISATYQKYSYTITIRREPLRREVCSPHSQCSSTSQFS